jgi:hypothetical protein
MDLSFFFLFIISIGGYHSPYLVGIAQLNRSFSADLHVGDAEEYLRGKLPAYTISMPAFRALASPDTSLGSCIR